ncbi:MAG TPA: type II secretion system F family protein [Acidimicrobiia bacterium]|jgi:tight adherence protein B
MTTAVALVAGSVVALLLARSARRTGARERARTLGVRSGWRLPLGVRERLRARLDAAAVDVEPERAVEVWAGGAATVGMLALVLGPALVLPAVALAAIAGPVGLRLARTRRARALTAALPGAIDVVAGELRAGGTVRTALPTLAQRGGPLGADVVRLEARLSLGASLDAALERWSEERADPGLRAVAGALAVADGVGGRAASALDGLARSLRDDQGAVAEARALSAQARLSAVVVGAAPLAYLGFEALTDPSSVGVLVATPLGQLCLVLGLGLEALAALWMRHIVGAVS